MSLRKRLLLYLLIAAPLVWAVALFVSADRARHEVNELFDSELIRFARQVQATAMHLSTPVEAGPGRVVDGVADLNDLATAVWDASGRLLLVDREGAQLPWRRDATGFVDLEIGGDAWRVYYLQSPQGERLVGAGQRVHERDEVVRHLVSGQLLPWLLVLPFLLIAMAWSVRRALAPVRQLAADIAARQPHALSPVDLADAPVELQPLVREMNTLFARIQATLARERRFTADAAHELRTPLAALRAAWDVASKASGCERDDAHTRVEAVFERMERLVAQMLALSRVEALDHLDACAPIDWAPLVEQAFSDVLPLAERRRIELACEWGDGGPFPLHGDATLLAVLLRNLLDNAVRYADEGSTVELRFTARGLEVANDGPPPPPEMLERLGERFQRPHGQAEGGSGLGVSIVQRVADLHGLSVTHRAGPGGRGVVAAVSAP